MLACFVLQSWKGIMLIMLNKRLVLKVYLHCYNWATTCDFQQCGIMTSGDSDEPVQPPFRRRNSKWCLVSSLTIMEYSSDLQRLWSDCAYAQADLRLCWSRIPHCWKSHALAHIVISHIPIIGTAVCSLARHFILFLVLVQPERFHPTWLIVFWLGCKEWKQTKNKNRKDMPIMKRSNDLGIDWL